MGRQTLPAVRNANKHFLSAPVTNAMPNGKSGMKPPSMSVSSRRFPYKSEKPIKSVTLWLGNTLVTTLRGGILGCEGHEKLPGLAQQVILNPGLD